MKLSKAAREKLTKEATLYEQTCYFIIPFDPTDVLDLAYKNIDRVLHDLDVILFSSSSSSSVDDVSLMINEYRSKVEKELLYICDKSYDIETRQAFKEFLVHFKQGDLTKYRSKAYYSRYASPNDILSSNSKGCTVKEKEKAPQLTKLEMKQQNDEEKSQVYLKKLNKEYNDYHATLRFMLSFLRNEQVTNEEHSSLLMFAYMNIMDVCFDLRAVIKSNEVLCDKDVSLILNEYRSKVENELQGICDNVANLTVQEAYLRHLNDLKTGFKLSAQDHQSHLQNEDSKIMSSKPKMSVKKKKKKSKFRLRGKGGSGSCKTPSLADLHINGYLRAPRRDHSECCMKKNHLETSDWEWHHPILRITRES